MHVLRHLLERDGRDLPELRRGVATAASASREALSAVRLLSDEIPSEIGTVVITALDGRLCGLDFDEFRPRMLASLTRRFGKIELCRVVDPFGLSASIHDYLRGDVKAIDRVPVETGGTALQRRVWEALRRVPPGTTVTYGDLAREVGRPHAPRAIGTINGQNPVAIVVPCHRVIGADASPTGYGGGLWRKVWLLRHEGAVLTRSRAAGA